MLSNTPAAKADEIINLLQSFGGSEYIGEPVTKLEHMIQSALLAKQQGLTDEVVIAAFLHDIGHISYLLLSCSPQPTVLPTGF